MNKIEEYKQEKDGLDVLQDVPRYAAEGWEAITDGDKERLKWAGVFFRKQTPGNFMMRIRMPNGITSATQLTAEPLLKELRYDPSEIMRGLVSCTGMDYCHFALIETKQ